MFGCKIRRIKHVQEQVLGRRRRRWWVERHSRECFLVLRRRVSQQQPWSACRCWVAGAAAAEQESVLPARHRTSSCGKWCILPSI